MSTAEPACYSTPEESGLRVETLPFDRVPQQTRLFLEYLNDPVALRRFYPSAVRFHHELPQRAPEVLAAYRVDRNGVCNALAAMNQRWGARDATLANIELLRESDTIAVVSGQQAGLFTGPLYTIYKALSAVKLAGCLTQRGTKAVPVFWMASEDGDFAEVAKAEFIGRDCQLKNVEVSSSWHREGQPVGHVITDESIDAVVDHLFELLPNSEFAEDIKVLVKSAWQPGRGYAECFGIMMTSLLGRRLVTVQPCTTAPPESTSVPWLPNSPTVGPWPSTGDHADAVGALIAAVAANAAAATPATRQFFILMFSLAVLPWRPQRPPQRTAHHSQIQWRRPS